MKKVNFQQSVIFFIFVLFSIFSCLIIFFDFDKPSFYAALPILPLIFAVASIAFYQLYSVVPNNIGASILIVLFFVRDVVSPLLMCMGGYTVTITKNIESNTPMAIFLVAYETVVVFAVMYYQLCKYKKYNDCTCKVEVSRKVQKKYAFLLFSVLAVLLVCIYITPSILLGYRSIFDMFSKTATHFEDAQIVKKYGTTFVAKLTIVMGQYLMRSMMVFVPAFFIVVLSKKRTLLRRLLALCCCLVPLFFIGGAIARSLIYVVSLILLVIHVFSVKVDYKKILGLGIAAGVVVISWWVFRAAINGNLPNLASSFSKTFSAYFSGVNIVSGAFNLPEDMFYKIQYFLYDFFGSVPFGTTLFNLEADRIQPFFNLYNESSGQIPTTIGMGYYYFGYLFAPIYSAIFAIVAFRSGKKIENARNPFSRIRLILMAFYFSLGIVMYNIEILLTTAFSIFLPMYLIEYLAYRKGEE